MDSVRPESQLLDRRSFMLAAAMSAAYAPRLLAQQHKISLPSHRGSIIDVPDGQPLELVVGRSSLNIDGRTTDSPITINGMLPGPVLRMREGQSVVIRVRNTLDEDTSIHWHGIILPYTMDGVPGVSFPGIRPGETFEYRFRVEQSGTYWYHSHSGLQEQLGLFGALVVEPADSEPHEFQRDYTVVLSDWMFGNPYVALQKLKKFGGYYNYQRPTLANLVSDAERDGLVNTVASRFRWDAMRMDPTDIADITGHAYTYLMNGMSPDTNWTAIAEPGEVVRLRLINAATMTYFDFRIPGLPMTVVAADGQPVKPVETDEIRLAVAETYDVLVTMPDSGAYTLFAETMDRSGYARGTLATRTGVSGALPARRPRPMRTMADMGMGGMAEMSAVDQGMSMPGAATQPSDSHSGIHGMESGSAHAMAGMTLPTEDLRESVMHGPDHHGSSSSMIAMMPRRRYAEPGLGLGDDPWRTLTYGDLRALHRPPGRRAPTRQFDLHLTGNMERYIWGFDGKKYSEAEPVRFLYGERLRISMINDTMMDHPIHLHGMWMDLYAGGTLSDNPRKHTVSVKPGELLTVDISADAPGRWAFHCHLLYHMEMGMFRTVAVVRSLDVEVER